MLCRPQQSNEADDLFLAAATGAAAFLSVLAGKRFNLDLSARLFVIAFVIVSFNAQQGKGEYVWAGCRRRRRWGGWSGTGGLVRAGCRRCSQRGHRCALAGPERSCQGTQASKDPALFPAPAADPFMVAVTRVCGIAAGVATMLLMSVLILPKSASVESLRT